MIGEIGALGGAILPNAMGLSKTHTGSFAAGFLLYSLLAAAVLIVFRLMQRKWVGNWIGRGGRPLAPTPLEPLAEDATRTMASSAP
jgi:NNP family nitrate/nitrite transporter-like MFS transporter